jgi:outer membrane murein-binding lipoprotein Lpp
MLDLFLFAAAFGGGYLACVYSWPGIKVRINGLAAEAAHLRARAQQLENNIRGR